MAEEGGSVPSRYCNFRLHLLLADCFVGGEKLGKLDN